MRRRRHGKSAGSTPGKNTIGEAKKRSPSPSETCVFTSVSCASSCAARWAVSELCSGLNSGLGRAAQGPPAPAGCAAFCAKTDPSEKKCLSLRCATRVPASGKRFGGLGAGLRAAETAAARRASSHRRRESGRENWSGPAPTFPPKGVSAQGRRPHKRPPVVPQARGGKHRPLAPRSRRAQWRPGGCAGAGRNASPRASWSCSCARCTRHAIFNPSARDRQLRLKPSTHCRRGWRGGEGEDMHTKSNERRGWGRINGIRRRGRGAKLTK